MNLLKDKQIKKLFVINIIIIILFTIFMAILTKKQTEEYKNNVNIAISNIVGLIKKEYPNVNDEEIISILNNTENSTVGNKTLAQYGIDEQDYSVISMKNQEKTIIITL